MLWGLASSHSEPDTWLVLVQHLTCHYIFLSPIPGEIKVSIFLTWISYEELERLTQ
jgi:hypothetical protein